MISQLTSWTSGTPPVIAVVDDDETERYLLSDDLRNWGYNVQPFKGSYADIEALMREIKENNSDFVICDNHLQQAGYAGFFGAEAVVNLNQSGIPSILVTQHQDTDATRLKRWRAKLPVILDKNNINQRTVELALEKCIAEINGTIAPDRLPVRVLVEVDAILDNEVIVFVDAWALRESVTFPLSLLNPLGNIVVKAGTLLLADVNIGANNRRDLFFSNFELAPEPDSDDGLA